MLMRVIEIKDCPMVRLHSPNKASMNVSCHTFNISAFTKDGVIEKPSLKHADCSTLVSNVVV